MKRFLAERGCVRQDQPQHQRFRHSHTSAVDLLRVVLTHTRALQFRPQETFMNTR